MQITLKPTVKGETIDGRDKTRCMYDYASDILSIIDDPIVICLQKHPHRNHDCELCKEPCCTLSEVNQH